MSVTSNRSVLLTFTGDIEFSQTFDAETNATGSGQNQLIDLAIGNNTITVPTDAVAVTIIKPNLNTAQLLLKGVNGDTGVALNLLDPDSISLESVTSFVLNSDEIVTVRLIFS